ncbi:PEP-CTERM sorting domain-containing protein [Paucibacter sp. AS339]|uniref:PEP-CTERM sorting domain-containing protein n=1 Tax=Paucibacter hankyongi TaxID=3133434 RepID=UPI00309DFA5D
MNRHSPKRQQLWRACAALLLGAALAPSAQASFVGSRAALAGSDSIKWGQLGADEATVASPAVVSSVSGAAATVSNNGGDMTRFDEGGSAFAGNFAIDDQLLTNVFVAGAITIDFLNPVAKVGAQLTSIDWGSFVGIIEVFDTANLLLESYEAEGLSSGKKDNSALFLGVSRASADIDHVSFSVRGTAQGNLDFALNELDFTKDGNTTPVPEPASGALVGAALFALYRSRQQR